MNSEQKANEKIAESIESPVPQMTSELPKKRKGYTMSEAKQIQLEMARQRRKDSAAETRQLKQRVEDDKKKDEIKQWVHSMVKDAMGSTVTKPELRPAKDVTRQVGPPRQPAITKEDYLYNLIRGRY
jgi:hypothetical protein